MSEYDDDDWNSLYDEVEAQQAALEYKKREILRVHAYDDRRQNSPVDWASVLSGTLPERQYLSGDLFEVGQQVSLIGEGKVGKSILALDLVRALANGKPFLGAPARPPVHVGYFDMENDLRTLAERAISLGITSDDFANVTYLSFPSLAPLDTRIGGEMLMEEVEKWQMKVVVLDTISRFIEGRENDADTWLAFYRCTGVHLKANNVALVRLDHMGKDSTRGGRGSSAKTQDVDHVYELTETGGSKERLRLTLRRTFTRSGGGAEERQFFRVSKWDAQRRLYLPGETKHIYTGEEISETPLALPEVAPSLPKLTNRASELVDALDRLNVRHDASVRVCKAALITAGETVSWKDLQSAVKFRKDRGPFENGTNRATHLTDTPPTHPSVQSGDTETDTPTDTPKKVQVNGTDTPTDTPPTHFEKSESEGVSTGGARVSVPLVTHSHGPENQHRSVDDWPSIPPPS